MDKTYLILTSLAAITLAAPAFAADYQKVKVEQGVDGDYAEKTSTKDTNAAGTTTKVKRDVDVDVDGNKLDGKASTKVVSDPKGLMNKETTTTKEKADVDVNADGSVSATVDTKVVNDPAGLLNKTTTKVKDTATKHPDGSITHKKTVDGKIVEDTTIPSPAR